MKYRKKAIDTESVKEISSRYNINLLLAAVLARRGITESRDILYILEEDLKYTHNPFLFNEMEEVVDRIHAAADEGEKVMVFGDRDADGITSTVLIVKKLLESGIDAEWSLPSGDDPYGFTIDKVDEFADRDGTLIITVDCGISSVNEIKHAGERGIDTIIIDHHTPGESLPEAFAVINPKMEDSGYPFRDLAGCGVVSKVIWALTFSETELYKKNICLLNIIPGGSNSYIAEAQKLFNLVESEEPYRNVLMPGMNSKAHDNFKRYLEDSIIVVYMADIQKRMFAEIFGGALELGSYDISDQVNEYFPRVSGMSLIKMREISRDARYSGSKLTELDILKNLFKAIVLKKNQIINDKFENMMDLVTIGSIADMMPLVNENRIIVKHGLKNIQNTANKGLHELLFRQKLFEKPISTTDIAWNITPLINATGRMGVPEKAARLFFSEDREEIRMLADEIISLNRERKKVGDSLWDMLYASAKKSLEEMENSLVITGGNKVNRGITGILSARFSSCFNVPAIVYTVIEDRIVGSLRSVRNYPIMDMMSSCSSLFMDFGGHDFAGGFSMKKENLPDLKKQLLKYLKNNTAPEAAEKIPEIDAELPEGYLNNDVINVFKTMMPYGEGNPQLVFLARKLTVKSLEIVGNRVPGHLKMTLDSGSALWPAIMWNGSDAAGGKISVNDMVDTIFRIKNNHNSGNTIPQIDIIDIEKSNLQKDMNK